MKWYWWLLIAVIVVVAFWWGNRYVEEKQVAEVMESQDNINVKAFLAAIRFAEGTAAANGYNILYGHTAKKPSVFTNMADHPYLTGEWKGVVLSDAFCKGAGQKPGCKSTAAGAYQITQTTWKGLKKKLGLKDFSPASQDLAAIELIREKGALEDIKAGRFSTAVSKLNKVWASLPGYNEGQPEVALATIQTIYKQNGGAIA